MRVCLYASVAVLLFAGPAFAQNDTTNTTTVIPPAPAIVAAPDSSSALPPPPPVASPPPGLVQTPVPPANTDNGTPAPDADAPLAIPNNWAPGTSAKLGVLNKVDGSVSEVVIPVGGQASIGDLQVSVLACVTRPPDEVPDAAIFLAAQDNAANSAGPIYRGWMVRSVPGAAVVGDASETFRVISCS